MTERPNKRQRSESYGEGSNLAGKAPTAKLYVQSIHIYSCAIYSNCYFRQYTSFKTSAFSPVLKRHIALFFAIPLPLHSYTSSSFTASKDYHVAHPCINTSASAATPTRRVCPQATFRHPSYSCKTASHFAALHSYPRLDSRCQNGAPPEFAQL